MIGGLRFETFWVNSELLSFVIVILNCSTSECVCINYQAYIALLPYNKDFIAKI